MTFKMLIVASALIATAPASAATFISFSGLTGAVGSTVSSYSESGYTFTGTAGSLSTVLQYGSKALGTTSTASVALTYPGGTFALNVLGGLTGSSTGSGTISYTGFLGSNQVSSGSYTYNGNSGAAYYAISAVTVDRIVLNLVTGTATNIALSGFSVSPAAVAPVPEPASWLMMVGGFGILGSAMRHRRLAMARA